MASKKRLVVIDGKSVFYRGYYAMPNLATKEGIPTGGVYGFAVMALEVIKRLKPDYVAVAWDKPKTNIRKRLEIYPEYKAGRKPAPPDFYLQIPILHELLQAFNWPLLECDDYEADDIMCTYAHLAEKQDIETILVSSDLDILQCVSPKTSMYVLKKGLSNIEHYRPEEFEQKYGLTVDQFADLKSLKGDASDNIPGVPGIGEKTAIDLLKTYKTLDGIYENVELVKGAIRDKLKAGKDSAYMSKKIVLLMNDAPVPFDLEQMDVDKLDVKELSELLKKLEFRSLLRQLPEGMQVSTETAVSYAKKADLKLGSVRLIDTDKGLDDISLNKDPLLLFSRAKGKHGAEPTLLALSQHENEVYLIDLKKVSKSQVEKKLGDMLADPTIHKIGFDLKATIQSLLEIGMPMKGIHHDILIAAFLINSLRREQTLTDIAAVALDIDTNFDDADDEQLPILLPEMFAVMRALVAQQSAQLESMPKVSSLAREIEFPVIGVLAEMERRGVKLDVHYLSEMAKMLEGKISDIEQTIYGYAEQEFNVSSPQQLAKVLFEDLQLPTFGIKKGKTGYSTGADALDRLRSLHPIIDCITQYREFTKLKSTYVDTLPEQVDASGRVHTTFSLTTAATGRLSSNDPNLQNIPVRSDLGKEIRKGFIAEQGNSLVSADYSQFELRLAAVLAGDNDLIDAFNSGLDIHQRTASEVYGIALEDVTKDQRSAAKTINFGVLYGMSPHGLSVATGMTQAEAKEFIERYFALRQPLVDYIKDLKKKAYDDGYVETLFGRRRPTPDVRSSNFIVREAAYRQAVNMPIQGTEADLMKMAMIEVEKQLDDDCLQLLQIHDSILVECPEGKAKKVSKQLQKIMENIYPEIGIKLQVDVHIGKNWGEL